jgi:hypothetical protein
MAKARQGQDRSIDALSYSTYKSSPLRATCTIMPIRWKKYSLVSKPGLQGEAQQL